jgi:hypothetical protein
VREGEQMSELQHCGCDKSKSVWEDPSPTRAGYCSWCWSKIKSQFGIRSVFTKEGEEDRYTFYDEQIFNSEEEAMKAINDSYGEELAQASTIDSEIESDLVGYLYSDLEPYLIEKES